VLGVGTVDDGGDDDAVADDNVGMNGLLYGVSLTFDVVVPASSSCQREHHRVVTCPQPSSQWGSSNIYGSGVRVCPQIKMVLHFTSVSIPSTLFAPMFKFEVRSSKKHGVDKKHRV